MNRQKKGAGKSDKTGACMKKNPIVVERVGEQVSTTARPAMLIGLPLKRCKDN
jgi:hypothetical protein